MAITSTNTFFETVDNLGVSGKEMPIELGTAYYGTLLSVINDDYVDYSDIFSFRAEEDGYYRLSWEFSRPGVSVQVYGQTKDAYISMFDAHAAAEDEFLIPMEAGFIYSIRIFKPVGSTGMLEYGFDLLPSDVPATVEDDVMVGHAGFEYLFGFSGNDTIYGLGGIDRIYSGEGNDHVFGGNGPDLITDRHGENTLVGGKGDDVIATSSSSDGARNLLIGNQGADSFNIQGNSGSATIYGGEGADMVSTSGGQYRTDKVWLGNARDAFRGIIQEGSSVEAYGGRGDDWIALSVSAFRDQETGELIYDDIGHVVIYGGIGDDTMAGVGNLYGGEGQDSLTSQGRGLAEFNRLFGGQGADTIFAARHGENLGDMVHGGIGNDELHGAAGRDTLDGGLGKDTIHGSNGRDRILLGEDGRAQDVVIYTHVSQSSSGHGLDRIRGFTSGIDVLDFEEIDASDTAEGNQILLYGGETALANGLWHQLVDGDTHVFLDVDGDALADMQVILKGVTTVGEGDFIL
ncbi:MAG TPA: hypothetical protein DC061_16160 [Gemmobacter sp.]|nr:hypothetical protein [Gemmobacter sp.]